MDSLRLSYGSRGYRDDRGSVRADRHLVSRLQSGARAAPGGDGRLPGTGAGACLPPALLGAFRCAGRRGGCRRAGLPLDSDVCLVARRGGVHGDTGVGLDRRGVAGVAPGEAAEPAAGGLDSSDGPAQLSPRWVSADFLSSSSRLAGSPGSRIAATIAAGSGEPGELGAFGGPRAASRRRIDKGVAMSKRTTLMAVAVGVGILTLASVQAQQKSGATLSAMDYIQINQLINRYAFAVDTGADKGGQYADLFAPDGKFLQRGGVSHTGREALANVGYRNSRGPLSTFHYLGAHAIEPTPDGNARGKEHLVQWEFGDGGKPSRIFGGGHYDDIYERTKDGWRFKQRQFIPSQSGYELAVPTTPVPEFVRVSKAPVDAKTMTASDYIEIQQVLARYPYALDTGQRHGQMWVDVFTPDATFNKAQ